MVDRITNQIEHYMDLLSARQKLVASNIANADTPGYKTKDIDFQFEFMSLMQGGNPNVVEAPGLVVKNDGNNVSMDREARLLSENALRFNLASSLMKTQLKLMNSRHPGGQDQDESVFGAFGERFGHVGRAHAGRTAGGEPGELRDHAHPGRRALPAQRRGLHQRAADLAVLGGFPDRNGFGSNGVEVSDVVEDTREPEKRYLPGHPDADQDGYVAFPRVNPAEDMVDLHERHRKAFEANVAAMTAIKDMILHSIDLMK